MAYQAFNALIYRCRYDRKRLLEYFEDTKASIKKNDVKDLKAQIKNKLKKALELMNLTI